MIWLVYLFIDVADDELLTVDSIAIDVVELNTGENVENEWNEIYISSDL